MNRLHPNLYTLNKCWSLHGPVRNVDSFVDCSESDLILLSHVDCVGVCEYIMVKRVVYSFIYQ